MEYLNLLEEKKKLEENLKQIDFQIQDAMTYSISNRELYDNLKNGLSQETTIRHKIEQIRGQIDNILKKEIIFRDSLDSFVKDIELNVCIPKLIESIKTEVSLILKVKNEREQQSNTNIEPKQIEAISALILEYLNTNKLVSKDISLSQLVDYVIAASSKSGAQDSYAYLEFSEVKALEGLLSMKTANDFPTLNQQRAELNISLNQISGLEVQIEQMKAEITGRDYTIIKAFEENEANIKKFELQNDEVKKEIAKIDARLHQFDIQTNQEPDPKYEALGKLKGFFEAVADKLLNVKKQQIEMKMKHDLNANLAAYRDVIDRVELSENMSNLTFKIYHKAGNELYLNQLNTASKQVVVQVLLKALHEFGDYDPPVMIDTVMGVLDETSRITVLENYFPELSHQTILLSSDSEIRKGKDYESIETFVSKSYTLNRNIELQYTDVNTGYFGLPLSNN